MADAFNAALWVAIAFAVCGLFAHPKNRTVWALLAGIAVSKTLDWRGFEFDRSAWMMLDLLVIAAIVPYKWGDRIMTAWGRMSKVDMSIVLLFPLAWMVYLTPDPWRYYGSVSVVIAQLLLTFPWRRFYARFKRNMANRDEWTNFDPMVSVA